MLRNEPALEENNNGENEDEWLDVDSINDIEALASTNEILREHGERSYQKWKVTVRRLFTCGCVKCCCVSSCFVLFLSNIFVLVMFLFFFNC